MDDAAKVTALKQKKTKTVVAPSTLDTPGWIESRNFGMQRFDFFTRIVFSKQSQNLRSHVFEQS
jgi:hypothetical protein